MIAQNEPLPPGWRRDENGALRRETKPQKLRRCLDWDYRRPGAYSVTVMLADRSADWLGRLVGDETRGWSIEPTALGEIVIAYWRDLATLWPGVEPREAQLMPDHFHGILRITTPQRHPLGQIIGSFKAKATGAAREYARASSGARGAGALGAGARGWPLVPASLLAGKGLFSPGFNDLILWDLTRYRNARAYLLANPARLAIKRAHPDLFRVVRDLAVELGGERPSKLGCAEGARTGRFMAIGNHFLLKKPLFQVQCSRRDFAYRRVAGPKGRGLAIARDAHGEPLVDVVSAAFEARRDAALTAAVRGAVLISPCVSDGEREIAREALAAGLPLVTLQNKGFSPLQKPSGRYFDACAEGRLLMLAPAAWPYQPGHKPMTRDDATALNRLCLWLAGDGAATINYRGVTPENIDALALAAVGG